jgi:hypothetical protein
LFRRLSKEMKILAIFFSVIVIFEAIFFYYRNRNINNLWLIYPYAIIEYGLLTVVFSHWLSNVKTKRIALWSIPLYGIISIVFLIWLEREDQFNNYSKSLECILLISISAYTLLDVSKHTTQSLLKETRFWVSTAVLIYYTSSLMLNALSNMLMSFPLETVRIVWTVNTCILIVANLLYSKGFLCQARNFGGR